MALYRHTSKAQGGIPGRWVWLWYMCRKGRAIAFRGALAGLICDMWKDKRKMGLSKYNIVFSNGRQIGLRILNCSVCAYSFDRFCSIAKKHWHGGGLPFPAWCPLPTPDSISLLHPAFSTVTEGSSEMKDQENGKTNLDIHVEAKEVRDIIIKLFADMHSLENMGLEETLGDQREMDIARALITNGINGIMRALRNCNTSNIPELSVADVFQWNPIQDRDLGHWLNKLYWVEDDEDTEEEGTES